jgi:hypothetical protein
VACRQADPCPQARQSKTQSHDCLHEPYTFITTPLSSDRPQTYRLVRYEL